MCHFSDGDSINVKFLRCALFLRKIKCYINQRWTIVASGVLHLNACFGC